ncbi:hypothetical protein LGQ02_04115 [Bacillus shivajii]|nr:hypothetical protein [Bacillus shivajii]UCZ53977.1 hypothetical protein LGQ02_04115 [Bacillus shivajii]
MKKLISKLLLLSAFSLLFVSTPTESISSPHDGDAPRPHTISYDDLG